MSTQRSALIITSLIVLTIATFALSDYKDDSKVTKISGGEDYSLILTANKCLWGCGDNYYYQLGIGEDSPLNEYVPVHVHGPGDVGFLDDINDFDAGWMHSLALDVTGLVLSWGNNSFGQLGDNTKWERTFPVKVHGYNNEGFLDDINSLVWAWGKNHVGQLGDGGEEDEQQWRSDEKLREIATEDEFQKFIDELKAYVE